MTSETTESSESTESTESTNSTDSTRATSFGAAAGDYDRYRIGAPEAVVDRLLPRAVGAVLDLGAGTGAMTRRLVGRAERVYAVDPDPRMTELLSGGCPGVEVHQGTAERIPLPDGCVDAVVVASAWHWMDPATAIPEIVRVLRPSGSLNIVWNRRDRSVPWVADLEAFRLKVSGGDDWVEERIRYYLREPWLPEGSGLADASIENLHWSAAMTKDQIARLLTTFHAYIAAPEDRKPEMLSRFTEYVHGDERIVAAAAEADDREDALVPLPMVCHLWRATLV